MNSLSVGGPIQDSLPPTSPLPRWNTSLVKDDDYNDILALFPIVFGHPLSPKLLQWKYGNGRGQAIIARAADGRLIAHYGGISRRIRFFGEERLAVQICDVMVESRERGVLTRKGPFFLITADFLDRFIGFGRKHLVGFGFPTNRHLRLAEKLGLYDRVGAVFELRWPAAELLSWRIAVLPLNLLDKGSAVTLNALWETMRHSLENALLPVRDALWWQFRYAENPEYAYRAFLIRHRLTRRAIGAIVLKESADGMELMDWISPVHHALLMVSAARTVAARMGKHFVMGWFSDFVTKSLSESLPAITDIDVGIPTNVFTDGPSADTIAGRWWLTGGDTDFR